MATGRDELMAIIKAKYPKLFMRTTEEFDGTNGGIWSSGENGDEAADEFRLFDYYNEDYKEVRYVFGVHKEFRDLLEANGWFAEWHDAGTVMFFVI